MATKKYQLYQLASGRLQSSERNPCEIKSFLPQINSNFFRYSNDELGDVYEIFGIRLVVREESGGRSALENREDCINLHKRIIVSDSYMRDEEISQSLRGSNTLAKEIAAGNNVFFTGKKNKIIIDARGICICRESENNASNANQQSGVDNQDINKAKCCYLLALVYNLKSQELLLNATNAFESRNSRRMIAVRDEIYAFDLKFFFENPVKIEVFETHELWKMVALNCEVKRGHDEMKEQVSELADIIEARHKNDEDRRNRRNEWMLTVLGTIIAMASLISVFKDAKELFGF